MLNNLWSTCLEGELIVAFPSPKHNYMYVDVKLLALGQNGVDVQSQEKCQWCTQAGVE